MVWLEVTVTTNAEVAEAVVELFNRDGRGSAVVEIPVDCFEHELPMAPPATTVIVRTYLPLDGAVDKARRRLEEGLWHLGQIYPIPEPVIRELAEEDWSAAWKQHYHLLRVGRRTVIVPAWEAYEPAPGEAVIRLEPGMAFGTGLHPTTRLCIQALEVHLKPGCSVLDVGTGSGVLAIAAAKLGASSVLALDNDPVAVRVAGENAALNGVADQVTVQRGSLPGDAVERWGPALPSAEEALPLLESGQFDLVVINILAKVVIGLARALSARLAPRGRLIVAGLIENQEGEVVRTLRSEALQMAERTQEQDWVCLVAHKA